MSIDIEERHSSRIDAWLKAAGHPFSRPTLYNEIRAGRIVTCKRGHSTLILTHPREYLEALPKGIGPAPSGAPQRKAGAS
jgi:hypothetical protein